MTPEIRRVLFLLALAFCVCLFASIVLTLKG